MKKVVSSLLVSSILLFNASSISAISTDTKTTAPDIQTNPAKYANWKEELARKATSSQRSLTRLADNGSTSNEFIEFKVASDGTFTIGTTGGNPDSDLDNNKCNKEY